MRRAVLGTLLMAVSAGAVALGCAAAAARPPESAPSRLLATGAPELNRATLTADATGAEARLLLADFRGRLVIVDFFAEFCEPCLGQLPELEAIRQSRPEVAIVGVAEDADPEISLRVVQQLQLRFPIVYDRGHVLSGRYRVAALPATFVLDRAGVVRWVSKGACARAELEAVLDSLP
jgi:thiol-disulfide isomerase/thioredoxin